MNGHISRGIVANEQTRNLSGKQVVLKEAIEQRILLIRGRKVMLSTDLAALYGVQPRVLVQAVKRNKDRFPEDFMFQLSEEEFAVLKSQTVISSGEGTALLRSQIVTLKRGRGKHSKYLPYAFTEQGVAMLSSVLRSRRAVQVNIAIMRAFVRLREILVTNKDLARKFGEMEKKYDAQFRMVFEALRNPAEPTDEARKRRVGFLAESKGGM